MTKPQYTIDNWNVDKEWGTIDNVDDVQLTMRPIVKEEPTSSRYTAYVGTIIGVATGLVVAIFFAVLAIYAVCTKDKEEDNQGSSSKSSHHGSHHEIVLDEDEQEKLMLAMLDDPEVTIRTGSHSTIAEQGPDEIRVIPEEEETHSG